MNAISPLRILLLILFVFGAIQLLAGPAAAAEGGPSILHASFLSEIVGDRSRMIQASLVFVLLGCAMLWWRK